MKSLSLTRSALSPIRSLGHVPDTVIDCSREYSQYTVPRPVAQAIAHAAETSDLGRQSTAGGRHLRQSILHKLDEMNGLEAVEEGIVITAGGTAAFSLIFATLCDAGDQILVPDPGWPGYAQLCEVWGADAISYPIDPSGMPDLEVVEELVGHNTKAIVISLPAHPTGGVMTDEQQRQLMDFAHALDLYVISDETFDLIRFGARPAIGPARHDTDGRVVSVFSLAKTHALAGLRLGYAVAAPPLAEALRGTQSMMMVGPSTLALAAGDAALDMEWAVIDSMLAFYTQQRETALAWLPPERIFHRPDGTYFLMVSTAETKYVDGEAFAAAFYEAHDVLVAPGPWFGPGAAQTVRLTFAIREKAFATALDRLLRFLEATTP